MVKLKKNSNTTVRKCGFEVHSNSPHDTCCREGGASENTSKAGVTGGGGRGDGDHMTRGKDLVVSCGCHVCFLVGGRGPTDGSIRRQRFGWLILGHGNFRKSKVNCFSKNWVVDREDHNGL